MRQEWERWKDLVVASGIILVLLASRAEGQVDVALLSRDGPDEATETALLALEKSREALLEARETIDSALRDVDLARVSLEATTRSRGKRHLSPNPGPGAFARAKALSPGKALQDLAGWVRRSRDGLASGLLAWGFLLEPVPGDARTAPAGGTVDPPPATGIVAASARDEVSAPLPATRIPELEAAAVPLPVSPLTPPAGLPLLDGGTGPGAAARPSSAAGSPHVPEPPPSLPRGREEALLTPPGALRATDEPGDHASF